MFDSQLRVVAQSHRCLYSGALRLTVIVVVTYLPMRTAMKRPSGSVAAVAQTASARSMDKLTRSEADSSDDNGRDYASDDAHHEQTDGTVDVDQQSHASASGSNKTWKMPAALVAFQTDGQWKRPQIQALNDFQKSLRKKGFTSAADKIKHCTSIAERQTVAGKLALCKTDADMHAVQTDTRKTEKTRKGVRGWFTKYQLFDLVKIPATGNEAMEDREHCLAQYETKSDKTAPGGLL